MAEMEGVGCVNDGLVVSGMYMVGPWIQGVTNLRFEHVPLTCVILILCGIAETHLIGDILHH